MTHVVTPQTQCNDHIMELVCTTFPEDLVTCDGASICGGFQYIRR